FNPRIAPCYFAFRFRAERDQILSAAAETENAFRPELSKSSRTCSRLGQKRRRASSMGGAWFRLYRDRHRDRESAAGKSRAAHLSIAQATSADQSSRF